MEVNETLDGQYICARFSDDSWRFVGHVVVVPSLGAENALWLPASLQRWDHNGVTVTRVEYLEGNTLNVVYAASGVAYVAVEDNVPKSIVTQNSSFYGNAVVVDPDPILRVYLRAENGRVDVTHYSVADVSATELPKIDSSIRFASCSLSVDTKPFVVRKIDSDEYVMGEFRIYDGDDPVAVSDVVVRVGSKSYKPQFSPDTRSYTFLVRYDGSESAEISAKVAGCPNINYSVHIVRQEPPPIWLIILAILFAAAAVYFAFRR